MDGYIEWNWLPQPPLGFPRGEAVATKQRHFGTDVFVVTDEGRREVGS